ncbi:MAG: hypothetical protein RH859_07955 [Longimicrobiales bacterium]
MRTPGVLAAAITVCVSSVSGQMRNADAGTLGLQRLVLDGFELHASLVTPSVDGVRRHPLPLALWRDNPQLSTDGRFVEAVARRGSQGRLDSTGMRAALYARYLGESDVGFYGLEAASAADADGRERLLREIWANNVRLDRARVHRQGRVLVVVWTDGVSVPTWDAVNAAVIERLAASSGGAIHLQESK